MENEEMTNSPDEGSHAFDGPSYGEENEVYDHDRSDGAGETDGWYRDPDAKPSESPKVRKLLDELTEDGTDDTPSGNEGDVEGHKDVPAHFQQAPAMPPRTAEEEEMELLKHVKSERGRERIRSIISARKEAEMQKAEAQTRAGYFQNMLDMTGLDKKDLARTMEYGRLVGKGDERSLEIALDMLEQQRDMICKKLGRTAPGIDLLSDFPELKRAVGNRELSMEHALKLAKYEREERAKQVYQDNDMQRILKSENLIGSLSDISRSCDNFFRRYEKEADYPAKMRRIAAFFADPEQMNTFLKTVPPPMWFNQMKFMYENMAMPSPKSDNPPPQPLRSRSVATGAVADNPNMSNFDRIMKRLDSMGI